jgi:lipopolysaccharide transport system ATP-binding protein
VLRAACCVLERSDMIRIERLAKQYRIGASVRSNRTFREAMMDLATAPVRRIERLSRALSAGAMRVPQQETHWALRDVSFDVRPGEVVGLIGRNGAGKSTLLKILSRITAPTSGRVTLYGRVGSLLEVGTGFHSELTGRENIYLNGVILGLTRREIDGQFDAIVSFAGVEQFLDTPVKRYSSGMYVRLAFAVAAHLTSEILIVDEVLAVGDAEFQRKCLGKMHDVAGQGKTVLFVSHNMAVVQTLCRRGIFLRDGAVFADDTAGNAVAAYLRTLEHSAAQNLSERADRRGSGHVRLRSVLISTGEELPSAVLATGRPARFVFDVTAIRPGLACAFTIYNQTGQPVAQFNSAHASPEDRREPQLGGRYLCHLEELPLVPGRYRINVALSTDGELQDHVESAAVFDVEQGELRGRPVSGDTGFGSVCFPHRWAAGEPDAFSPCASS